MPHLTHHTNSMQQGLQKMIKNLKTLHVGIRPLAVPPYAEATDGKSSWQLAVTSNVNTTDIKATFFCLAEVRSISMVFIMNKYSIVCESHCHDN